MWHAFADTMGLRLPSVSPNQLAAPWRRRAPWDVPLPLREGFGIPNRSPDPLVRRAGRDHPFPIPWKLVHGTDDSLEGCEPCPTKGKDAFLQKPSKCNECSHRKLMQAQAN
jgi:hypothetical protein